LEMVSLVKREIFAAKARILVEPMPNVLRRDLERPLVNVKRDIVMTTAMDLVVRRSTTVPTPIPVNLTLVALRLVLECIDAHAILVLFRVKTSRLVKRWIRVTNPRALVTLKPLARRLLLVHTVAHVTLVTVAMETLVQKLMPVYPALVIIRRPAPRLVRPNINAHVGMDTKVMVPNLMVVDSVAVSRLIRVPRLLLRVMNTPFVIKLVQAKVFVPVFLAILELVHLDNAH